MRNLRKTCELVVDVQVKARVDALEIEVIAFALRLLYRYFALIMVAGIDVGNVGRVVRERVIYVGVLKTVVAVVLHARRHLDFVVGRGLIEVVRNRQGAVVFRYRPLAVEVDESAALFSATERVFFIPERNIVAARVEYADDRRLLVVLFKHLFSPYC